MPMLVPFVLGIVRLLLSLWTTAAPTKETVLEATPVVVAPGAAPPAGVKLATALARPDRLRAWPET